MVPDSVQPEMPWVAQNEGYYVGEMEWDSLSANESTLLKSVWSLFSLMKEKRTCQLSGRLWSHLDWQRTAEGWVFLLVDLKECQGVLVFILSFLKALGKWLSVTLAKWQSRKVPSQLFKFQSRHWKKVNQVLIITQSSLWKGFVDNHYNLL